MDNRSREKLIELIQKNVKLFNMSIIERKDKPFILQEDFHISTPIQNNLFSWNLQFTISFTENRLIHLMMFLHPIIINTQNRLSFIRFANAANMWLGSALGKFWVNDDNDFCYEMYLPEFFLEHLGELERQLFDNPFSHFQDCLTPLLMLKQGRWNVEKAIAYIDELREEGVVDNDKYDL